MSNSYKSAGLFICFIHFPYKYKKSGPVPFPGHPCFFRLIFIPFSPFWLRMPPGQLFALAKPPSDSLINTHTFSVSFNLLFYGILSFSVSFPRFQSIQSGSPIGYIPAYPL